MTKLNNPHEFKPTGRLKLLIERVDGKKNVPPDIEEAAFAHVEFDKALANLLRAEGKLEHAMRGLEHHDYDAVFEGWVRENATK